MGIRSDQSHPGFLGSDGQLFAYLTRAVESWLVLASASMMLGAVVVDLWRGEMRWGEGRDEDDMSAPPTDAAGSRVQQSEVISIGLHGRVRDGTA